MIHRAMAGWLVVLGCCAGPCYLRADVKLPSIFDNHMVLQQDAKLPVWGIADPGEKVKVAVGDKSAETTAGADGQWRVELAPLPATSTPVTMTVTGKNTLTFSDILVGEVWLLGGQSNMASTLTYTATAQVDIPQANDPQLRYFNVARHSGLERVPDLDVGKWTICTPETAVDMSAVGYHFGRQLRQNLKRPVALICNAVGGTPIGPWVPLTAYQADPALKSELAQYEKVKAASAQVAADYPAKLAEWQKLQDAWLKNGGAEYNARHEAWTKLNQQAIQSNQVPPPMPEPAVRAPSKPPPPDGGPGVPSAFFNGAVLPISTYAIRGAVWYQGETNAGNAGGYGPLLSGLIKGWRAAWGQGDFPFIVVQLPKYKAPGWALMREVQWKTTASLPNTGLVILVDVGDPNNIHPRNKTVSGERVARVAEHLAYAQDIVWSGPLYDSMQVEGKEVRLHFTQTGGGLIIGLAPWTAPGATPVPNTSLLGFAVAGADKKWFKADARIDQDAVVVSSAGVPKPVAVRYGWENSPDCNLYNKEGLPASPFRTDAWKDVAPLGFSASPLLPEPEKKEAASPAPTQAVQPP